MKILFDQNLSPKLAKSLQGEFPGSVHVIDVGLDAADDWELWSYAAVGGFVIASKDTDFRHRSLMQGHPPKVILVTTGNCPTDALVRLFCNRCTALLDFERHKKQSLTELK